MEVFIRVNVLVKMLMVKMMRLAKKSQQRALDMLSPFRWAR